MTTVGYVATPTYRCGGSPGPGKDTGNNGAGDGIVDASSGTTSTAEPPQWQNVEVSNPRSETHGDAPRPPLQLKDIKVSANASEATATISWNTEVQSDSIVEYGSAAPPVGAVEWKTSSGGNGHFYYYNDVSFI